MNIINFLVCFLVFPPRVLLDKMVALDLPAPLDLEASPETLASPDPRDLL